MMQEYRNFKTGRRCSLDPSYIVFVNEEVEEAVRDVDGVPEGEDRTFVAVALAVPGTNQLVWAQLDETYEAIIQDYNELKDTDQLRMEFPA